MDARSLNTGSVTPALDAGVHEPAQRSSLLRLDSLRRLMDRRVKPGDDSGVRGCIEARTEASEATPSFEQLWPALKRSELL